MTGAGAFIAALGTLLGAFAGQFLGVVVAGLLARLFDPEGGMATLGILVLGMVLGAWPGGVGGLWAALRLSRRRRAGRAALLLALLTPLLAPVLGIVLPGAGVVLHPLMIAPLVALLGAAAYLLTARE